MRKFLGGMALAMVTLMVSATPAWAHSCANVSRRAPTGASAPGGQGRWFYLQEASAWVFDMPNDGSLLEGSRHCTVGVPQADKVYWNWTSGSSPGGIVTGCGEAP